MNQERIGKFIAEQRKVKSLTQEQLAEKLGISKNAVSKWERGICLMDMSLLNPLSKILDVSINELLAGEKLSEEEIIRKSEENIVNMGELVELRTMKYGVIGMAIFFIILVLISTYKDISPYGLLSMICAYNAITFLSRYRIRHDKTELLDGVLFLIATLLNTITFIIM